MIRVLHVLDHSIPLHSGYTFRTAALLREQRALGWETFHLTSPKQGATATPFEDVDGLRFYRTPLAKGTLAKIPLGREIALMKQLEVRLEEVARETRPDIIHAHSPVLNALPAIKVARKLGIPVVYEIRAFWEDAAVDHGSTSEGSLRYRATRRLETRAIQQVDHVFTICEGLRADIVARGIPADKVTVIPNAVDVELVPAGQPARPATPGKMGPHRQDGGRLHRLLLRLRRAGPAARRPAGTDSANARTCACCWSAAARRKPTCASKRNAWVLVRYVIFTGRVPHKEVNRYYDLIDVLAYPRHPMRLTELVTPLKPLEAMAQGQLFVASDVGGHKELIDHGQTGILFKAGDRESLAKAIINLLEAPAEPGLPLECQWPAVRRRTSATGATA